MNSSESDFAQLSELLDAACDGTITQQQSWSLQQMVNASSEARSLYVAYMSMCAHLRRAVACKMLAEDLDDREAVLADLSAACGASDHAGAEAADDPVSAATHVSRGKAAAPHAGSGRSPWTVGRVKVVSWSSAAVVLLLLLTVMAVLRENRRNRPLPPAEREIAARVQSVARLTLMSECVWENDASLVLNAPLAADRVLRLRSGVAEITFQGGGVAAIEGPAEFVPLDANRGRLNHGSLLAKVPRRAIGFTVDTRTARVVDLGTEFGMLVDELGHCEVHLIAGAVEVTALDGAGKIVEQEQESGASGQKQRLGVGDAVRVAPHEGIRPITPAKERFAEIDRQLKKADGRLVYNLQRDFSTTENTETSVWSYRYKEGFERDGNYPLLPNFSANAFGKTGAAGWLGPSGGDPNVSVFKNNSGRELTLGNPVHCIHKPERFFMHPGEKQLVIATWTAPEAGTVGVRFKFSSVHFAIAEFVPTTNNNGIEWFVDKGAETLDSGAYERFENSGIRSLSRIEVAAGERIHFIVDPKSGRNESDGTEVFVEIRYVSPPANVDAPQGRGLGD